MYVHISIVSFKFCAICHDLVIVCILSNGHNIKSFRFRWITSNLELPDAKKWHRSNGFMDIKGKEDELLKTHKRHI